ncbi:MAG TPA: alkaline phosphatase family protein, partial [Solirubrobacteraceae bacterium]|nr:alkaline phosphatase family protein [Solirubrobacteraceae bacterium]
RIRLDQAFSDFAVARPSPSRSAAAELALSPAQRSAMIYALDTDDPAKTCARARKVAGELEGVDLVMWCHDDEAIISGHRGELRFTAGGELTDTRGNQWSVEGDLGVLRAEIQDGRILSTEYPDGLGRVWSALRCPTAGDILLSAAPGYEFVDWGGSDHVGGGSHGSLHRSDSLGALLWCGTGPDSRAARDQWSLRDIAPMIRDHFGLESGSAGD